jgi:ABC-type transport system involved in cytochrome c biogenesis permease subunit
VRGHFANLVVYSGIIATFFSVLTRRDRREQLRFGGLVWLSMVLGVLLLAYLMFPFPK